MKIRIVLMLLFFTVYPVLKAQDSSGSMSFTLAEAQEYALQNNKLIKASKLDVDAARMSRWQAISSGLPKMDASASLTDNLKLATVLVPDFTGMTDEKIPIRFGSTYNTSYGFQVSQLIFSASYLVGLQTSKIAEGMSEQGLEKSELDIKESVISTYYLILLSEESLKTLEQTLENMREIEKSTRAMYEVGMAESTDVDQILSNITMISNSIKSMERNVEVSYNLLRFQMGLENDQEIVLSETLESFIASVNIPELSIQDFNLQGHIDYRLLMNQEKMSELNLKMEKSATLPSVSGFYSYNQSGQADKLSELEWYPSSMVGLQLNIPIFASGSRYSKIRKAEFDLEKIKTNKSLLSDQLLMQEKQLKFNLVNASEQFNSQSDNIDLSMRIYRSVENKYKQGMASSLELTQAHGNYLDAVSSYNSSLMNLLQTKLSLDKMMNNL